MKVKDAAERIFTCEDNEVITVEINAKNTLYTVLSDFHLPVPNKIKENGSDSGKIEFTFTNNTVLTLEFHFSGDADGVYELEFTPIEDDADGIFHQTVKQMFGAKKRMRLFSFIREQN